MPEPLSRPADILDQLRRIDSVCARFERSWKEDQPNILEHALEAALPEDHPVLLAELLPLEWTYRRRRQHEFTLNDYCARFAALTSVVTLAWRQWQESADHTPLPRSLQSTPKPAAAPGDPDQPTLTPSQAVARQARAEPQAGLAGYHNVEPLGEGGMGVVYKAYDTRLKRPVALKKVRGLSPDRLARFRIEAEALARLSHPHIVGVHAWDEKDGEPILVMEYVSGGTLDERLQKQPLNLEDTVRLVAILARAVQSAHEAGVVHRDLKPANVLLAPAVPGNAGTVAGFFPKVSDFGLARLVEGETQTVSGMMLGTPSYVAPEQAEGRVRDMGPAADTWALGVILYRCLSGKLPFVGQSALHTMDLIRSQPPTPLRQQVPGVPTELEALCQACLTKSPASRPTAAQLAEGLERYVAGQRNVLPDTIIAEVKKRPSRRRVLPALVGLVVLGAGGVAGWQLWPGGARKEPEKEVTPAAVAEPFRVKSFVVRHYAVDDGKSVDRGEVGKDSVEARYKDEVRLEVELSEPAYVYLLGFNPDGTVQLHRAAEAAVERVRFPGQDDETIHLDDDAKGGLQAFAVVASRRPLPAFASWPPLKRGMSGWEKLPGGGGVWFADREAVQRVSKGKGVERGSVKGATGAPPLRELVRSLATGGVELVEVIAFAVVPRGG